MDYYVNKFINNLPKNIIENTKKLSIDLILEGGSFNGSYHIGALYFLKAMENKKYITIDRISGASIGTIVSFLYITDNLDLVDDLYSLMYKNLKNNFNLSIIKELKQLFYEKGRINDKILEQVNNKLFITYYNINKYKKIVKKKYKSIDDIFDSLIKSCYLPFFIDGNILYKNKYVDGFTPYIFSKTLDKRILYIDILEMDKILNFCSIKNELSNDNRVLSGLVDIFNFFIKSTPTSMCSYTEQWGIYHNFKLFTKQLVEQIIVICIYFIIYIKSIIPSSLHSSCKSSLMYSLIETCFFESYKIIVTTYCI